MSMTPCPGCGLPRITEQLDSVPCPICATTGTSVATAPAAPAKKPTGPDPTAGLPSDVSQLHTAPRHGAGDGPNYAAWFVTFVLGVGTGVGGLLGWQALTTPTTLRDPRLDTARNDPEPSTPVPPVKSVAVAPMPHAPRIPDKPPERPPDKTPNKQPDPKPQPDPKFPAVIDRAQVVPLNDPEAVHELPAMLRGERVVLKGKIKTLRIAGLDAGAILDATGLEVTNVFISGRVDGQSLLRLAVPSGVVTCAGLIAGKSTVEVTAPGGSVNFGLPARATASIDGGARVIVTARKVELRGDVNGIETRVTVNLPADGTLRVAGVRGIATVEYRVADGKGTPEVTAEVVSPTANFKKVE